MYKKICILLIIAVVLLVFIGACSTAIPTATVTLPVTLMDATGSYCGTPNPMPTAGVAHNWAAETMKATDTYTLTSVALYLRAQSNTSPSGSMWVEIQGVNAGGFPDGIALSNGISTTISTAGVTSTSFSEITFEFNNCGITKDQLISVVFRADQDWDVSFARNDGCPLSIPNNYVGINFFVNDPIMGVKDSYNNEMMFLYGHK